MAAVAMTAWERVFLLGGAGAIGTLSRAGLSHLLSRHLGAQYPWGTTVVNVLGCLLFGLVWALTERGLPGSLPARYIVLTGFMGAFTTFSTYLFETSALLTAGRVVVALGSLTLQNVLGMLAIVAGMALGRWL